MWMSEAGVEELDWPAQSGLQPDPKNTFGVNYSGNCEAGLLIQNQCLTSQIPCKHLFPRQAKAVTAAKGGLTSY